MKRIWFALLVALLFVGCSSDNDETNTVNSHTVTLSDVKGTWVVVSAMPQSVVGIRLVLNDKTNCVWSDKFDNTFSGPYYFLGVTALIAKHLIIGPKMGFFYCAKPLKMGEMWCVLVCLGTKISKFSANF